MAMRAKKVSKKKDGRWTPERLKALREDCYDETQEQFRHRIPCSISSIKFWETKGQAPPYVETILDFLEATKPAELQASA